MKKENKPKKSKQEKGQAKALEKSDADQKEPSINELSNIPGNGFKRLLGCG